LYKFSDDTPTFQFHNFGPTANDCEVLKVTLHPQCKAFLDQEAAANLPDITEQLFLARVYSHREPDIAGPIEDGVQINHCYFTSPTADLPMNIYTPEGKGPFSCMVYFHGGGWVLYYPNRYDAQLSALAKKINSVIVAPNYQKAPEHKFPTPFNDCYAALEWTIAHAEELGIDISKVGIGGDSAGGNLAAAVALKTRDEGLIALAYQLLIYPCNSPDYVSNPSVPYADGYGSNQIGMKWAWEQYLNGDHDKNNPYAVPHSATNLMSLPPTIIITAEFDVLREDGLAYAQKLRAAGVKVIYKEMAGMIHGFFNYGKYIDEGIAVRDYFAKEINRILNG
jgi:acetyl esterase